MKCSLVTTRQWCVPLLRKLSNKPQSVSVPSVADCVVIGGGSIGCNTVYHLVKEQGIRNVVLLEKDKLTAGTTWHTAGLLWCLRPGDVDIELIARTKALNEEILPQSDQAGVSTGWIRNGGLFIASTKERMDEYKRLMTLGKCFEIESYVLGPNETKKLYPLMNTSDIYATLHSPADGLIDPSSYCHALTRAAEKAGARIIENCPVTAILSEVDDFGTLRVSGVETPYGTIRCKLVANCAGAWSPKIGEMAKVNVPLCVMRHAYVITERIEGIQNMPNVRDHDLSIYLRLQGDALAIGGYEPNPEFVDSLSNEFAFSLYDLNWDVFSVHITGAVKRIPALEKIGIKSQVCGPESFTADHKPLMGESPELRGFYLGCGFNSAGMMFGGGCGQQLAHWIVHGRPKLFMHAFDIRRFYPKLASDKRWLRERSHESYAKNYSIVFPHDEPLAARNQRKDPFYEVLLEAGCVYQERLGWERPAWFSVDGQISPILPYDYYGNYGHAAHSGYIYFADRLRQDYTFDFPTHHDVIEHEALTCRKCVAVFNMSYFGKYYLIGPDAHDAVDWIFSANMAKPVGATTYTCMLNRDGKIEADLTVSKIDSGEDSPCDPSFNESEHGFYIAAGGGIAFHVWCHIQQQLQDQKFQSKLIDMSENMGLLSIQGPKCRELLGCLLESNGKEDILSDNNLPFSSHRIVTLAGGHKCRLMRISFVGELGYELHIPASSCVPVYRLLMDVGKRYGIVNAGYRAIDALSAEKGYRLWTFDLRNTDTPLEAGLAFTCKLKQNVRFLGREAIESQKKEGIRRKLVYLTIDKHQPLWALETVFRNGEVVGFLRRGEYAFTLRKSIGFAYLSSPGRDRRIIDNDWIMNGEYEIESMGERLPASVHLKSPFDPDNKRLKGIYD